MHLDRYSKPVCRHTFRAEVRAGESGAESAQRLLLRNGYIGQVIRANEDEHVNYG